jgi:hypothetical protein
MEILFCDTCNRSCTEGRDDDDDDDDDEKFKINAV